MDEITSVALLPDIKVIKEKLKNLDKEDIYDVDNLLWDITKAQLLTFKNIAKDEEQYDRFMSDNIDLKAMFTVNALAAITNEKLEEYSQCEEFKDADLRLKTTIYVDKDLNRHIDFTAETIEEVDLDDDDRYPPFNDMIEKCITNFCREALSEELNEEELEEFINDRLEDYKEEPYSPEWLEGFIAGYFEKED